MDPYKELGLKNINLSPDLGEVELGNQKIIFSHYPDIVKRAIINNTNFL